MTADSVPLAQRELKLDSLREIFHSVDQLSGRRVGDREVYEAIAEKHDEYDRLFLRWLVRHTLHPESEDDIMPDEVEREQSYASDEGYTLLEVYCRRVPPTIRCFQVLQYRHQFWHVIEFDPQDKVAVLRPLASYDN